MVPAVNWHVTLRFLGDVNTAATDEIVDRLRATPLPTATVVLGPRLVHLGPRQVVVPVAGADRLAEAITTATADLSEPPRRTFTGHLTVARLRRGASSQLPGLPIEAGFTVEEIELVESTLSPDGAVYETVDVFPTTDPS